MKAAVIYYSFSGNTRHMGELIAKGIQKVEGCEARTFSIDDVDFEYASSCDCIIFGAPIYAAHITGQMMNFMLTDSDRLNLAGKLIGAFATAKYVHGGAELGIREILDHCMVKGAMIYSGGDAMGEPVIHFGPIATNDMIELERFEDTFVIYGERMAAKAKELFG